MGTWRSPETGPGRGSSRAVCTGTLPTKPGHTSWAASDPQACSLPLGCEPHLLYQLVHPLPRPYSREALPRSVVLPPSSVPAAPVSLPMTAPFFSCPALPRTPEHPPLCLHRPLCFVLPNHWPPCGLCPRHPEAAFSRHTPVWRSSVAG